MRGFAIALAVVPSLLLGVAAPAAAQTAKEVFQKASASVVVIRAKGRDVARSGDVVRFTETGSGVLVTADGKIMTAAHVVHTMDEITVQFPGGEVVPARVIASEPAADLSLIQVDRVPAGAVTAPMADSDSVQVGDRVIVIGAPYGLTYSLSAGLISARWAPNTVYKSMPLAEFLQTDAVINTGNSGGPMFDTAGRVIGIVSHNISKSGGSEGLGFVVTINTARKLLLEEASVWTGLEGRLLDDELADILNLPEGQLGYLVKTVAKNSPGQALGVRGGTKVAVIDGEPIVVGGDIILKVLGIPVSGLEAYERMRSEVRRLPRGATLTVTILRAGRVLELSGPMP